MVRGQLNMNPTGARVHSWQYKRVLRRCRPRNCILRGKWELLAGGGGGEPPANFKTSDQ